MQVCILMMALCFSTAPSSSGYMVEPAKDIPLVMDVDVAVVGGSSAAVQAACAAAESGARVFLIAPRPYLGTDICGTLRLWLEDRERPKSPLAKACFGRGQVTKPLRVKAAMDQALADAGVTYLTGCFVTDVLQDRAGRIAGVAMVNRTGRQAVKATVVIDATSRAVVARLTGTRFRPFVAGLRTFRRVVIGGTLRTGQGIAGAKKDFMFEGVDKQGSTFQLPVYEYHLQLPLERDGYRAWMKAEQQARDMTFTSMAEWASETLWTVPPETIVGQRRVETWPGAAHVAIGPFRPKGISRLYVLSAHADLGPRAAEAYLRPLEFMAVGARIGAAAAAEAAQAAEAKAVELPEQPISDGLSATVAENLDGIRSMVIGKVPAGPRRLPVIGRFDVVVVGGGTSGTPAGIAAARSGARVLVVEYLYELGGVSTAGLIDGYWFGRRKGFPREYLQARETGCVPTIAAKAEWLRRKLLEAGAEVWLGAMGCGALLDGRKVIGVVVATPRGRGAVLAKTVIDATGNADIAAAAGAATQYGITENGALNVQIAGFPRCHLKRRGWNTAYTIVDDTDVRDVWHLMTEKRLMLQRKQADAFDVGQLVDSRERRRIVGDYMLTVSDILTHRTFPDTISQHYANFDAAAFPDDPVLLLADAKGPKFHTDLPYRCLLPKDLDGVLVVGLGCSAQRDAMTLIRMQADLQNQGYAAGVAAAMAALETSGHTRQVDVKAVQRKLVSLGVLDQRVLNDVDSFPMNDQAIARAVRAVGDPPLAKEQSALAVIVAHPERAKPLIRTHYHEARDAGAKLRYARVLGILGDPTGAPTLIAALDEHEGWDKGVSLSRSRAVGNVYSDLDRVVIALGFSQAPEGLDALLRKLEQLQPDHALSHYKAMALALRRYGYPSAAEGPLAKLLSTPAFTGHAVTCPMVKRQDSRAAVTQRRDPWHLNRCYRELITAALLYRCGDRTGKAKTVLEQYADDINGHFARYALYSVVGEPVGHSCSNSLEGRRGK